MSRAISSRCAATVLSSSATFSKSLGTKLFSSARKYFDSISHSHLREILDQRVMAKPDLALSQIAARFTRHDVEWSRGAFMIIDRRTANPIARLRPIPDTDRFELFYWSNVKRHFISGHCKAVSTTRGGNGTSRLRKEKASLPDCENKAWQQSNNQAARA
jgi:hypothetical protein